MIEVKDLYFRYRSNKADTIKNVNFSIKPGEIFGFLGPSGAGKSTTQKIIIGILKNYRGSVRILGNEIRGVKQAFYEKIGVAFEFPNLFIKFTALENLNFFSSLYKSNTVAPENLLKLVGLSEYKNTIVGEYSKGMKMRLNFCRALINDPEIVFFDEPTSGLDPVNARKIMNIIISLKEKGKTIFLTTHNMNVAEDLCDQVGFIVDGQVSVIESPRNLKIANGHKTVRLDYLDDNHSKSSVFKLDELGKNTKFLDIIKNKKLETIHSQEATLEEVFIKITGRTLH